jgi:hypothetical protein
MNRKLRTLVQPVLATPLGLKLQRDRTAVSAWSKALVSFDRPRWLYRPRGLPSTEMRFRDPRPVTDDDVALCRRLIDAYALALEDAPSTTGMWAHDIFRDRQQELIDALERRDAPLLAERLASMFRSDFVGGMALGSFGLVGPRRVSRSLNRLHTLSKLAALGESLGTAYAENPEQGRVGAAFAGGLERFVADTEAALGTSIDFPEVGAAYGVEAGGRLITHDSPDQINAAMRLRKAIEMFLSERDGPLRVVEIGGGYGGMAYWFVSSFERLASYTIIDLPVVNVIQGYFLSQALGAESVSLHGESPARVAIAPTHALAIIATPFDVLANKDSMPEIPEAAVVEYLSWARENCTGIFYSANQEGAGDFDGTQQIIVREAVARTGGFVPVRRDPSWLRRGYVEEIFARVESDETVDSAPQVTQSAI